MDIKSILTGGFAKGYRTYILVALAVATLGVQYAVGDIDLVTLISNAATALGVGTLRSAVN